ANILITSGLTACIGSFSLSSLQDSAGGNPSTPTVQGGNIHYMAPELFIGDENLEDPPRTVNFASDIYSLGCVFHAIYTGQPLFAGLSPVQLLLGHTQNHTPARPPVSEMDDFMWELINQCCSKNPSHRPQASDIIHSLQ
ncbi:kinase-like domain-containing protein, partial [Hygrophoropsis aurantiaca]